ncbi:MAG: hypothetical protein AB7G11_02560 [Phycisphaerales bacterium]
MSFDPTSLGLNGWIDSPRRYPVARSLRYPVFAQAAPYLMGTDQDVFLYRAWKDVIGNYPNYKAQTIGDCVSQGAGHAIDLLQCVEIAIGREAECYKELSTEAIYGLSREIAGMLGDWQDGCFGSAAAKAYTDHGVVPREIVGEYDGKRAKNWGYHGVPAEIRAECAKHKGRAASKVATCEEADAALGNGYPITVASNQGFTMTRNADGVCRPQGQWMHQMASVARRKRAGKRQYLIIQSWGPNVPDGPLTDDQPDFSFWIDDATFARMLAQQDSFAFSAFDGFPGRPLPSAWTNEGWIG